MVISKQKRAADIQESIRQILLHDWNPIGFEGLLPNDEYDNYIPPVYRILVGSRSEQELVDFLSSTVTGVCGSPSKSPEQLKQVAHKLLGLDVTL